MSSVNFWDSVKSILGSNKEYPVFDGKNWQPAPQTVIKDREIKNSVENDGYKVVKLNDQPLIERLTEIYKSHHRDIKSEGGMFYSVYSQDIRYRRLVHDELQDELQPVFENLFYNYRSVINSFIIKHPGPKSEFYLHQDSTGLNEWKYSPLSMWMPLQDVSEENGCMWVIPNSHKWFSPYRGISFPSMFEKNQDLLRPYIKPLKMKLGEVLLFDNRMVHLSGPNKSMHPRVVVMSGIFPRDAGLISCYRDVENNGPLEIFDQDEDFLLKNLNFYIDCTARPKLGTKVAEVKNVKYELPESELNQIVKSSQLECTDLYGKSVSEVACDIIQEPK